MSDSFTLSEPVKKEIDSWVSRYPEGKQSAAVMAALRIVQENHEGWLSVSAMDAVANHLGMPKIAVYEVASFYTMYNRAPVGRHVISLCTNISCMLNGSESIKSAINKKLGIGYNETTPDGKFTLKEVECLAACCGAPMMQIGKEYYENLTEQRVHDILDGME